jgi:glycosyltransferase involved in cell wall biosynthesis
MYKGKTVSIVMSTYNEKDSIRKCIEDFFATGFVDEVVIVNNNAAEGTDEEVKKTKARLVYETKQGYGHGFQKGLAEAKGDLIVMCEPDGTFYPSDLEKYLVYSQDMMVVQGSRTNETTILDEANMGIFLKYGNYAVAKMAEWLYMRTAPNLSDCGCTYRLFRREAYEKIRPYFREGASAFGFELTLLVIRAGIRMCEIPIHYGERVGRSAVTGSSWSAFKLGMKMIWFVIKHRSDDLFAKISLSERVA